MPAKKTASKPTKNQASKKATPKKAARTVKAVSRKKAAAVSGTKKNTTKKKVVAKRTSQKKVIAKRRTKKVTSTKSVQHPAKVLQPTVPAVAERIHKPRYDIALSFLLSLGAVLLLGFTARQVWAAEFIEPPGGPEEGNIPVTVWNRDPTVADTDIWDVKQLDTSINIDGQIYFGDTTLELADDGVEQYGLYGLIHYWDETGGVYMGAEDDFIHMDALYTYDNPANDKILERFSVNRAGTIYSAGGASIKSYISAGASNKSMIENDSSTYIIQSLARFDETSATQNYKADPDLDYLFRGRTYDYTGNPDAGWTTRFTVDVTGDVWAKESITSDGCFGPTFIGNSVATFRPVDVSGYYGANNNCAVDFPGAHVCTAQEMLESIRCSEADSPIRAVADDKQAWINAGPPGYTANANDCLGWTVITPTEQHTSYGRFWIFNAVSGGRGTSASCNATAKSFACCK